MGFGVEVAPMFLIDGINTIFCNLIDDVQMDEFNEWIFRGFNVWKDEWVLRVCIVVVHKDSVVFLDTITGRIHIGVFVVGREDTTKDSEEVTSNFVCVLLHHHESLANIRIAFELPSRTRRVTDGGGDGNEVANLF